MKNPPRLFLGLGYTRHSRMPIPDVGPDGTRIVKVDAKGMNVLFFPFLGTRRHLEH